MKITRTFFILISCMASILLAANVARIIEKENTPQKHKARKNDNSSQHLHTRYVIGSDRHGKTLYKEYSAIPPVREMFPNWLAADSLYERGTPEWERIALHPAMLIDEWELELQSQRLADEP